MLAARPQHLELDSMPPPIHTAAVRRNEFCNPPSRNEVLKRTQYFVTRPRSLIRQPPLADTFKGVGGLGMRFEIHEKCISDSFNSPVFMVAHCHAV